MPVLRHTTSRGSTIDIMAMDGTATCLDLERELSDLLPARNVCTTARTRIFAQRPESAVVLCSECPLTCICIPSCDIHSIPSGGRTPEYMGWAWTDPALQRQRDSTHVATVAGPHACCEGEMELQCRVMGKLQKGCLAEAYLPTGADGKWQLSGDDARRSPDML